MNCTNFFFNFVESLQRYEIFFFLLPSKHNYSEVITLKYKMCDDVGTR
jgi:hypothetical protein